MPADVAAAFATFPAAVRGRLLDVRRVIFATAEELEEVGPLTEALKWGEPAYLTAASQSGSTIRLGWFRASEQDCAVLFNCRTSLVETFRTLFPDTFGYQKNRAILLSVSEPLPEAPLAICIDRALTYMCSVRESAPSGRDTLLTPTTDDGNGDGCQQSCRDLAPSKVGRQPPRSAADGQPP